jgi:hypothetical protein
MALVPEHQENASAIRAARNGGMARATIVGFLTALRGNRSLPLGERWWACTACDWTRLSRHLFDPRVLVYSEVGHAVAGAQPFRCVVGAGGVERRYPSRVIPAFSLMATCFGANANLATLVAACTVQPKRLARLDGVALVETGLTLANHQAAAVNPERPALLGGVARLYAVFAPAHVL